MDVTGDLVERERELGALHAAVDGALAGSGRPLLLEGPAGIGKTRLLGEVRRRAGEAGALVLSARGSELEQEFAFGVVRQLLEAQVAAPGADEGALAGAAAAARPVFAAPGDGPGGEAGDGSFAALHGLYWLVLNLAAERPVVLLVDDLHWCDRPSLRFLAYLVRRLEDVPVLLAATVRSSEPGTDAALLSEIAADVSADHVRPGPLTEDGAAAMVREALGAGAEAVFCTACHRATGGNPLLLRQLLRALEAEGVTPDAAHVPLVREIGPGAVSRTLLLRLARLDDAAVQVARAVAVLGDGTTVPAVAVLTGLGEEAVAEATGALARAEILAPTMPLAFVHQLVRDTIYREMPPGERELRHARAATLLRDAGAPAEQVAAQLLAVPPHGERWAAEALHQAGRAAIARGAADSAVAILRRALAEPPPAQQRAALLLDLGLAESYTDGDAAVGHLLEAHDLLEDPLARATTALGLSKMMLFTGRVEQGIEVARRAQRELPPELGDLGMALEAVAMVAVSWGSGSEEDTFALDDHGLVPHGSGVGARMLAIMAGLHYVYVGRTADEVTGLTLAALDDGSMVAADDGLFSVIAVLLLALCDRDEALEVSEASLRHAHRRGSLFGKLAVDLWRGFAYLRRGDLPDARASLERAFDDIERWRSGGGGDVWVAAHLAHALVELGELGEARRMLERGDRLGASAEGARWWRWAEAQLLLAEGRFEEALAVGESLRAFQPHAINPAACTWREPTAMALLRLGRRTEAEALLEEDLGYARRFGAAGTVGRALRLLGEARGDAGEPELREAAAVLEGSPAKLEHAKALAALGGLLRRARQPSEAREPLRRALDLAERCGATPLVEHVRSELAAAGARPRTGALGGVAALTASERRVAARAAEGATNRDIAQELYVTPKTVELHLSNAYRKLGIRSRRELPAELAREPAA